MAEVSVSGVSLSDADGVALSVPLFGLPGLEEGVSGLGEQWNSRWR